VVVFLLIEGVQMGAVLRRWISGGVAASVLCLVVGCVTAPQELPQEPVGPKTVRYLSIGNSFSRDATRYLASLAEADGHTLIYETAHLWGGSLQQQWRRVLASVAVPGDEAGRYGVASTMGQRSEPLTLAQLLAQEPWDYVSIQQVSRRSHDYGSFQPHADRLAAYVRAHAPAAELLILQTWAYRADDPWFMDEAAEAEPGMPRSRQQMHEQPTLAYEALAERWDARLIPVGDAFDRADSDLLWGFVPAVVEPEAYRYPALPSQPHSLHEGWTWEQGEAGYVLDYDGHHADVAGQFLGSCVMYELLFGTRVVGNAFVPDEIEPDYGRFLQEVAHWAVQARR